MLYIEMRKTRRVRNIREVKELSLINPANAPVINSNKEIISWFILEISKLINHNLLLHSRIIHE